MATEGSPASVSEALSAIADHVGPLPAVRVPLAAGLGLSLAEPILAGADSPPFNRATMDGFAVRSQDFTGPSTTLRVVGEIAAGQPTSRELRPGEAMLINTGAPMPDGADAVVMIEDTSVSADGRQMTTGTKPAAGEHVSGRGESIRTGAVALEPPACLGPAQMSAAAAAGVTEVCVRRRPRIAVLVTGDEVVPAWERPEGAAVRDSNGPCLRALVEAAGCEVLDLGIVGDNKVDLERSVREGLMKADLLCVSGGVSMGQHDHVPAVLARTGIEPIVEKVAIKPGKPMRFGIGPDGRVVFGMPGNPVSCLVCFVVFVRAALSRLQGWAASHPPMVQASLDSAVGPGGSRAEYLPAQLRTDESGRWRVRLVRWQGSGDPFGLAKSNGLAVRPVQAPAADAGEAIPVIPLSWVTAGCRAV